MSPSFIANLMIHSIFPMWNKNEGKTKTEFSIFQFKKAIEKRTSSVHF